MTVVEISVQAPDAYGSIVELLIMSFRWSIATSLLIAGLTYGGLAPAEASTDQANETCKTQPTGRPSANQRWAYRTDRVRGQRCWFLVTRQVVQPTQSEQFSLVSPLQTEAVKKSVANCIAEPSPSPPRGMQWRYRTDRSTGSKCWHLMRMAVTPARKAPVASSDQPDGAQDATSVSSSLREARAMLVEPVNSAPRIEGDADRKGVALPGKIDISAGETFQSRWVSFAFEQPGSTGSIDGFPVFSDTGTRREDVSSREAPVDVRQVNGTSQEGLLHLTLVVTLASAAAILALYALISAVAAYLRSSDVRSLARRHPSKHDANFMVSSPPLAPGISDVLDRLWSQERDEVSSVVRSDRVRYARPLAATVDGRR